MDNISVLESWIRNWTYNAAANFQRITKECQEQDMDFSTLPQGRGPAVVLGSGPSLEKAITGPRPALSRWMGTVFFSPSHFVALDAMGRFAIPYPLRSYMVAVDTGLGNVEKMIGPPQVATLITTPCVDPEMLEAWHGPKKYFLMDEQRILDIQLTLFPYIKTTILNATSVSTESVVIADMLGYSPIFLVGCDFGFPNEEYRFGGYKYEGRFHHSKLPVARIDTSSPNFFQEEGVWTRHSEVWSKIALLCKWKQNRAHIIDCSNGILREFPKMDFEDVVNNQDVKEAKGLEFLRIKMVPPRLSAKEIDERVDAYTVPRGYWADAERIWSAETSERERVDHEVRAQNTKNNNKGWKREGDTWILSK